MTERKSQPELIRRIWLAIKKLNNEKKPTNLKNVFSLLSNDIKITVEILELELLKAIDEDLVVNSNKANSPARILYQIPKLNINTRQRLYNNFDWYCYLCHTGENVIKCSTCPRAVHQMCASHSDEDETQETQPESVLRIHKNTSTTQKNPEVVSRRHASIFDGDICVDDSWLPFVVLKREPFKFEESELDETKPAIADDCQFVSVIRQPAKQKTRDIKNTIFLLYDDNEMAEAEDSQLEDTTELNLVQSNANDIICQHCKLLSKSDKNQTPNISVSELNSLLGFLFERIKPWISFSGSPLSKSFAKDLQEMFMSLFLKCPVTLESMKTKLSENSYKTLDEFYGDIMDFHHCIAIIYGTKSKEYYTSQQTKLECNYHITEIRSCHDCYRHSNQLQNQSLFWFTEPCTIRHELVFAKQVGFSYWPAKVLKVVEDDYDVRFFGPKHTRAIVKADFIKPIDTSLEELKIFKKSTGFVKAMEELEIYQQRRLNNFNGDYSDISHNNTSFELNSTGISNHSTNKSTANISLTNGYITSPASKSRTSHKTKSNISKVNLRNRNKKTKQIRSHNITSPNVQLHEVVRSPPILILNTENTEKSNRIKSINIEKHSKIMLDNIKTALNAIPMGIDTRKQILRSVELEVENLNGDFKSILRQVKKGEWCYVCGKIGKFYCCYSTFYCSSECQHKHWNEEHAKSCRKTIEGGDTIQQ